MKISPNIVYEEFLVLVEKYERLVPDWNYGTAYFNILTSVKPQLADLIRKTIYDPYNKDTVNDETHNFVKSKW